MMFVTHRHDPSNRPALVCSCKPSFWWLMTSWTTQSLGEGNHAGTECLRWVYNMKNFICLHACSSGLPTACLVVVSHHLPCLLHSSHHPNLFPWLTGHCYTCLPVPSQLPPVIHDSGHIHGPLQLASTQRDLSVWHEYRSLTGSSEP